MHILFVTPYPISRIRVRSSRFIASLVLQHTVEVLSLYSTSREVEDARHWLRASIPVDIVQEGKLSRYLRTLCALGTEQPLQVAFAASQRLRTVIAQRLAEKRFDILHIESVRALGSLPRQLSLPTVWDAVDCISELYQQGTRVGATVLLRILGRLEARRLRAYERSQIQRFDHILVTAERERFALQNVADGPSRTAEITVLPHGVSQTYFQRYTGVRRKDLLVFSGKMSFHANIAGVLYLVERILPLIWRQRPGVSLLIAGSDPPVEVRRLACDSRIMVTGYREDLRPAIAEAWIAVCSLPYAVGIQNKVLEAMALGTPVVASSSVAKGLQTVAERDLLIADDPLDFAHAVLRLLDDPRLWQSLSDAGVRYVATHHNEHHTLQQLTDVYVQAVETWRRRNHTYAPYA